MKKIYGFSYKELFSLAITKPKMAQIEVTRNCNQRCFFCFRKCSPLKNFFTKSLSSWQKAIEKLVKIGVRELNFSGGEIFLYSEIDKLFSFSKKIGVDRIVVNTNGSVDLRGHDLSLIDELVFSVHGLGKDHDKAVGTSGAFKKVLRSINFVLAQHQRVGLNTVVTPDNIEKLDQIYSFFAKFPLIFHSFNLLIDRERLINGRESYSAMMPKYLNFLKIIPARRRKLRHGMQNIFFKNKKFFESVIPLPHCAGGKYKLVVDYRGDIYPCRYFQDTEHLCGNIFKNDLQKVWKSGKGFIKFRKIVLGGPPSPCGKCFKKWKCLGGCLAWRKYNNITHQCEKDERCELGHAYLRG